MLKNTIINEIKLNIINSLKQLGVDEQENALLYETPPTPELGDAAFPMFKYSSILKDKPFNIAAKVKELLMPSLILEKTEVKGGYLNFYFNKNIIASELLKEIISKKETFGAGENKNQKIVVEFSCPNTNKPLHLGHCRNNAIGDSVARILKFSGYDVVKMNLINDRGIHICKSMLAYKKFGNNTTPESLGIKSDHFVGDYYVKYAKESEKNPDMEKEALELLNAWESGDKEVIVLWEKMNKWAIDGIKETYKRMNIEFDEYQFEHITYLSGKEIVEEGLKKNIFFKNSDNSVWIDNTDIGMDKKAVLRSDGTSIYITQDLGTAVKRHEKHKFDMMFYVVASEQDYHFKTLFAILKKLGYKWAEKCRHLSYGMVNLPSGKMKSREGTVIDADNLIDLLNDLSLKVIEEKNRDLTIEEKKSIAVEIGLSALKYYLLNFSLVKDVMFIPEKSISFDGNTGPYLQYTTARLNSLIEKNQASLTIDAAFFSSYKMNSDECNVIMQLLNFPDAVVRASDAQSPLDICDYLYNLARLYNKFYHDNPVLKAENEKLINFRLLLSKSVQIVLKNGLNLLGIKPLDKM